jgi:hypothetical protein
VTLRKAYEGLWAVSVQWHSFGVYGLQVSLFPVKMLFMSILDHLTLAHAKRMEDVAEIVLGKPSQSKVRMMGKAAVRRSYVTE